MKKTQVKTHRRGGKVVRTHSRTMKGKEGGFDKAMCEAKYKKIVDEKGKNHPMAKKLLQKLEDNGVDTTEVKRHARIDQVFMRKKIDKDLLVKESKTRKHARKTRSAINSSARGVLEKGNQVSGFTTADYRDAIEKGRKKLSSATPKGKKVKMREDRSNYGYKKGALAEWGDKSSKGSSGKVKNPKTGRMVSKDYLDKIKGRSKMKTTKGGVNLGRTYKGMEYDVDKKPIGTKSKPKKSAESVAIKPNALRQLPQKEKPFRIENGKIVSNKKQGKYSISKDGTARRRS